MAAIVTFTAQRSYGRYNRVIGMQEEILAALEQNSLLLTANRRLWRHWRMAYDTAQRALGHTAWAAPRVSTWNDWLRENFESSLSDRVLLSDFSARRLWQTIIERSDGADLLLDVQATAKAASRTWTLCRQYDVPLDDPAFDANEDTSHFREWAAEFELQCEHRRWLPAALLDDWVTNGISNGSLFPPPEIWLAGFDETTPAQQRVLAALQDRGSRWSTVESEGQSAASITRWTYADARQEIYHAACWSRGLLEREEARSVGIVVMGLQEHRADVESIFLDVLGAPLFNISLGKPLTQWPLPAAALGWLQWLGQPLAPEEYSRVLRSPFFAGGIDEFARRARLDGGLRASNVMSATASYAAAHGAREGCAILANRLGRAAIAWEALPRRQSTGEWSRTFSELLQAAGWPGDRTLSSPERQSLARWNEVLRELAALDVVEREIPYAEALSLLRELAAEAIFQPETQTMPVQILEALQAAGSQFDALWVMGTDDKRWPAAATPDPFLPRELELKLDLPHSSPDRELRFARDITRRLVQSARTVVFTHAARDGEEELRPSRLIAGYPEIDPQPTRYPRPAEWMLRQGEMEEIEDSTAPARAPEEKAMGGTAILANQSQCPFAAFAEHRLGAAKWQEPEPGLLPQHRGKALHAALAHVWRHFQTRDGYLAAPLAERESVLERGIDDALAGLRLQGQEGMVALEKRRLGKVLASWLQCDTEREPFRVAQIEAEQHAHLPLRMRADRIDETDRGLMVIDYKSTAPSQKVWEGERPDDLQLPLYAVTLNPPPVAIAFAQVKAGKCKLDVREVKESDLAEWRRTIDRIWDEFCRGDAAADPKDRVKVCKLCHLHSLCRIYEGEVSADAEPS